MAFFRETFKPLIYALRSTLGVNGLAAGMREIKSEMADVATVVREVRDSAHVELENGEQLMQVLLRQHYRAFADHSRPQPDFADVEFRCHSQNGEDGILLYIF